MSFFVFHVERRQPDTEKILIDFEMFSFPIAYYLMEGGVGVCKPPHSQSSRRKRR